MIDFFKLLLFRCQVLCGREEHGWFVDRTPSRSEVRLPCFAVARRQLEDLTQQTAPLRPAAPLTQYQLSVLTATSQCNQPAIMQSFMVFWGFVLSLYWGNETWNLIKCNLFAPAWLWLAHFWLTEGNFKSQCADTDSLLPQFSQPCGKLLSNNSNYKITLISTFIDKSLGCWLSQLLRLFFIIYIYTAKLKVSANSISGNKN